MVKLKKNKKNILISDHQEQLSPEKRHACLSFHCLYLYLCVYSFVRDDLGTANFCVVVIDAVACHPQHRWVDGPTIEEANSIWSSQSDKQTGPCACTSWEWWTGSNIASPFNFRRSPLLSLPNTYLRKKKLSNNRLFQSLSNTRFCFRVCDFS